MHEKMQRCVCIDAIRVNHPVKPVVKLRNANIRFANGALVNLKRHGRRSPRPETNVDKHDHKKIIFLREKLPRILLLSRFLRGSLDVQRRLDFSGQIRDKRKTWTKRMNNGERGAANGARIDVSRINIHIKLTVINVETFYQVSRRGELNCKPKRIRARSDPFLSLSPSFYPSLLLAVCLSIPGTSLSFGKRILHRNKLKQINFRRLCK